MLSFHVKFVQTDGQTDNGKTIYPPDLLIRGHKKINAFSPYKEDLTPSQTTNLRTYQTQTVCR